MTWQHLLRWYAPRTARRTRRVMPRVTPWRFVRPRLERLEDRTAPATFFVATTGSDGNTGGSSDPFLTIQHALNVAAANPGPDTIMVASGTYQEQLTINDPSMVTLTGAGAGTTIIQSPLILAPDASGRLAIVEMASPANVVMSGFTVTGPVTAGASSVLGIDFGILAVGAGTLDLSATTVTAIHPTDGIHGNQTGHGIGVGDAGTGRVGHANIQDVTVTDYNKSGIRVTGAGTTATITNNTVTGSGPTPLNGQNGITISAGATATVSGNTVSGNEFTGAGSGSDLFNDINAMGIINLGGGAGVTIAGNNVFANDVGIYNASQDPVPITGNTVQDNRFDGVVLEQGFATAINNTISGSLNGLVVVAYSVNGRIDANTALNTVTTVTGNSVATVTGNTISNNSGKGVWVVDQSVDGVFPVVMVSHNVIHNNGTGVVVGGGRTLPRPRTTTPSSRRTASSPTPPDSASTSAKTA